ncbi:MAG: DUF4097 domain-containing protein [Planctomycetes bacterium]|nr:DUF4097 domain-containing protein [Planctomycetota bacterium]
MTSLRLTQIVPFLTGLSLLVAASGCNDEIGGWNSSNQSRFERTVAQRLALDGIDTIDALSKVGSVTVTGADVADCNVIAKITAQAPTEEEAKGLAEQVEIVGQPAGSTLKIRSKEPDLQDHRWISVSYTITMPRRMNVRCESNFGSLDVSHVEGRLDGKSGNGAIKVQDVRGKTDLRTSFGSIDCRDVTGPSIDLNSGNGAITATRLRGQTTAETSFGAMTFEDFADGDLKLKSGNGRIGITNASFGVCDARSSFGAIAAGGLRGDSVTLNSGNGSVEIAGAKTKTVDLYSSFGSLRATDVTASNLSAVSGNGGVNIACSPAAPADLNARVRSSFGGVDFTAPTGFAGEVSLNANFGTVKTALPITVSGEISRNKITGKIGDGQGKIHIESGNGSVELK